MGGGAGVTKGHAFIACFSRQSVAREKSYQNEELTLTRSTR